MKLILYTTLLLLLINYSNQACDKSKFEQFDCVIKLQDDYHFHWALNATSVKIGYEMGQHNGWAAWGLCKKPNHMVGSLAMIAVFKDKHLGTYDLHAKNIKDVVLRPTNHLQNIKFEEVDTNSHLVSFSRLLQTGDKNVPDIIPANQYFIFAHGPEAKLHQHAGNHRGGFHLSLVTGKLSEDIPEDKQMLVQVHGLLMFSAFGFFFPLGIIIARTQKKRLGVLWFQYHRGIQLLGVVLAIIGAVFGILKADFALDHPHNKIGFSVVVITLLQPMITVMRCHPGTPNRYVFNYIHKGIGYGLVVASWVNIYLGLKMYQGAYGLSEAVFILYFALIITFTGVFIYSLFQKDDDETKKLLAEDDEQESYNAINKNGDA